MDSTDEMRLMQAQAELRQRELLVAEAELRLIDRATEQAILLVLLRRVQKRLSPAERNEISYASRRVVTDDYRPRSELDKILRETILDKELKHQAPR